MDTLPKVIKDIIINYKEELEIADKKSELLDELKYNHFCDYCDRNDCIIKFKDCYKLEEDDYAFNCGFCNDCIKIINLDRYYPNNT